MNDAGGVEVVLRGITHDIGPAQSTPSAPPPMVLAQRVLAAEREPDKHRAIVNLRTLTLLRWLDDPLPNVAWENDDRHPPAIHPDDIGRAKALSKDLATRTRVFGTVRLRSVTGEWMRVAVEASLLVLDQHTTAALVTVSMAEA